MARFRHTVTVDAVPRRWFDSCVETAHEAVESLLGATADEEEHGFKLVEGTHLQPGARYATADAVEELTLTAWGRSSETVARLVVSDDEGTLDCTGSLRTASFPSEVRLDGHATIEDMTVSALRRFSWTARADLEAWWSTAGGGAAGRGDVIAARVEHKLGVATCRLVPAPDSTGCWRIGIVLDLRGRLLLRPLVAMGLLMFRSRIRQAIDAKLAELATRWNETLPRLLATGPDELRALLLAELTKRRSAGSQADDRPGS